MNKYLEKIAFSRLSEASFKNLTPDEKAKVHGYISNEADNARKETVVAGAVAGGSIGALGGLVTRRRLPVTAALGGLGALYGAHKGEDRADKIKAKNIDNALNKANLASVLRQPIDQK